MSGVESMLLVWDIGGTLAEPEYGEETLGERLRRASPLPGEEVTAYSHRVLYTGHVTEDLIRDVTRHLQVDLSTLAGYRCPPMRLRDGSEEVLEALAAERVPMVAASNVSEFDAAHVHWLRKVTGPWLEAVYASYELRKAKPDPAFLHRVAAKQGVETKNIIMIGDRAPVDMAAADAVGARGLLISPDPLPAQYAGRKDEFQCAPTLHDALPILTEWALTGYRAAKPRLHPLRAVVVLTNELGEVLLVHAPKDGPWHLPGGGAVSGTPPHRSAEQELAEELDLHVSLDPDAGQWHWLPPDGRRTAHVVVVYTASILSTTPIHRNNKELDNHRWVPRTDAESLLFTGPAGDATLLRSTPTPV